MTLNIIVVGAGIGGPAVGAALAKKGHQVTIYERAQSTTDVGFAFRITSNSDRCLKYLGIDVVAGGAVQATTLRQFNEAGDTLVEMRENTDAEKAKKGVSVFASRPQLTQQLIDTAVAAGARIKTGVKVASVDAEKTEVALEDGSRIAADLIVAADGLYSTVRSSVVDAAVYKPFPTLNQNCFRFMIPRSSIQEDEVLSQIFLDDFRMNSWRSNDRIVVTYPVDFDRQYNIVCSHPAPLSDNAVLAPDAEGDSGSSYNKRVSLETVKSIYSNFEDRVHRMFDKADPDGFRIWKLQDLEELPRWSVNRTVLIGDAAHAVLPSGFSGASMTIEDGVMLAEFLPSDVKIEQVPSRLQLLEQVRKPRVRRVREVARIVGDGKENRQIIQDYFRFLSEYDTVEVAQEALKDHLATHS